jgi:putative transcriptional regulator
MRTLSCDDYLLEPICCSESASFRPEGPTNVNKIVTTGKRTLKDDRWHDDNGPLPDHPGLWEPPMTDEEVHIAALSDPDAQPLTEAQLAGMRRVSFAKHVRFKLGLSQSGFAERFHIPVGTLRDWEQHRAQPDAAALAYLCVIDADPESVDRALSRGAA